MGRPKSGITPELKRIGNKLDWAKKEKPDTLEKIRQYVWTGGTAKLSQEQMELYDNYRIANQLMIAGGSRSDVAAALCLQLGITESYAYRLIRESIQLFSDISKSDKKGLAYILTEKLFKIADYCNEQKDKANETAALKLIADINGLKHIEQIQQERNTLPEVVFITTDLDKLQQQIEDIPDPIISDE